MDPDCFIFQQASFSPKLHCSHHLLQNRFLNHAQTALPLLHVLRPVESRGKKTPVGRLLAEETDLLQTCSSTAFWHPPGQSPWLSAALQGPEGNASLKQRAENCQQAIPMPLYLVTVGRQCNPVDNTPTQKSSPLFLCCISRNSRSVPRCLNFCLCKRHEGIFSTVKQHESCW